MVLLWLDDTRDCFEDNGKWLVFSPIPLDELTEVIWVKSYNEFCEYLEEWGIPDACCFDHDLSLVQVEKGIVKEVLPEEEKTGKDCADFLVNYCMSNGTPLPIWNCQSANIVGKENINSLLNNFKKFQDESNNRILPSRG